MYFLMRWSKPISLIGGYSYRKEFAPLVSKFFPLSNPQIRSDRVSTIKVENKNILGEGGGMENCKNVREISEKSQGI